MSQAACLSEHTVRSPWARRTSKTVFTCRSGQASQLLTGVQTARVLLEGFEVGDLRARCHALAGGGGRRERRVVVGVFAGDTGGAGIGAGDCATMPKKESESTGLCVCV
jgi:hypothetical protein